ncbi:chitinase-3-like protein 2 isoform X2 [Neocloeon triangulifer]|uniref:chitinase-3-like protein 2 isoform X2 n=1 Tax=Neocloeon triangulifer TaxID=2078957 RepID=UPI00286F97B8|nr:chitinase-3-like protein 2 isoform X2 [Neocloeon triangulifer]
MRFQSFTSPILIILFTICFYVLGGNYSLKALKELDYEGFVTINSAMSYCIGQCLGLTGQKSKCNFEKATGQAIGGSCLADFNRPAAIDRRMICVFEQRDIDRGLTLDALIASKLCTTILVLVTINFYYFNATEPANMFVVDEDLYKKASDISSKPTVKLHYKLGTLMNMTDSMTPKDFSKTFDMPGRKSKWISSIIDLCKKPEGTYFTGLYIRWLYPGCPNDDCKIGPAMDEHTLIKALDELATTWKSKFPNKYWELAMETSAKSDNIYMGLGVEKLGKLLSYFLILNYEWAEPKPTTTPPKTQFQTPLYKNNFAIDAYLKKHKQDNKKFFYGVTTTLVNYALYDSRLIKLKDKLSEDEYFVNAAASNWILFKEACVKISDPANNFTIVVPNNENKTTYAFTDGTFIPFDETNDIVEKLAFIFAKYNNRIGGAWMKNISHDDFTGTACGCGPFPVLRAANEGLYGSKCSLKLCFAKKKITTSNTNSTNATAVG